MSLQIAVTDPEKMARENPAGLRKIVAFLASFLTGGAAIAAPDLPDVGAVNGDDAADAFQGGATSAAEAFANVATTAAAAFAPNGVNGATPGITAAPSIAGSSGPNVAPLATPNGAPPAPSNGSQTVGASAPVDGAGLPWDARIHAKSSTAPGGVKNADGTWRAKRGVDAVLVAQVEAELRQLMAAPAPVPGANFQAPPFPAVPNVPSAPPPPPAPPASPSASVPAAPVSAPSAAATNYPELIQRLGTAMGAEKLQMGEVTAICIKYGVADITLLPARLDMLPFVAQDLQNLLDARA